ncbi:MBL fold metallo-hydrolase [Saccharopolyspora sp. NFXS83]|uniref:MBL fold metallo-hydrolase n=1 Tax=Saccharopolyspora sp. NFXS83 TaxID=2993560 RepID=UPI00224A839C|nr:MBL fold metallo-hydrolase [Saccharopolyspora sp. NFXS83]MCX2730388.1 MBL fold metallo-hydrolase [Saccharopolyspora sp. NFXS83]
MDVDVARGRHEWIRPGAFEVAPGVHRIPLPMPGDGLRAVNVYAIEDGDGLVLVDAGWARPEARDALEAALGELGHGLGDVRRFLVTHLHQDHYTLAVRLRAEFGTDIALGAGERPSLDALLAGTHDRQLSKLERGGATELAAVVRDAVEGDHGKPAEDYEAPDEWLADGAEIELAARTLRVVETPGHTRGHVVFVDERNSLLFAGDHVLPHITPSIGLEAARTALPLGDYLDSLRLVGALPELRLLPAHGPVTDSAHARVEELLAHHEQRLDQTAAAVRAGAATGFEVAGELGWTRRERSFADLDMFNQILAVGETLAHLDVLVARGRCERTTVDGVDEYRSI